jgi:DNA-binding transcriptional MerR regulator
MTRLSFAHTRGYLGIRNGGGRRGHMRTPRTIKRGIVVKGKKSKEGLLTENEFFNATGLDEKTREVYERGGYLKPAQVSEGIKYYSAESVDFVKAVKKYTAKGLQLSDAYEMVIQGVSSKKRRNRRAGEDPQNTIDPRKIKTHLNFEGFLEINADLLGSITADMAANGYYESKPVVLATWPGQEDPVLIDGHTRMLAAIDAGIEKIFFVIEEFEDEGAALSHAMNLQAKRRTTDDWVLFQLIERFDSLMERGGDRRSEQAKSKGPAGPTETKHATSAERTAALVGCSPRKVKRARRIRKDGTSEILEALKNREMTISQAENAIIKKAQAEAENNTGEQSSDAESENSLVHIEGEYREILSPLEGTLHHHVNIAVSWYIRWLRRQGRLPEEEQANGVVDDENS